MFRREVFDEVGRFDEELPVCEDYDLGIRIAAKYPVYLLPKPLIVKRGGHADQLSRKHWGMDRFRIKALVKLIKSGTLNERQLKATLEELSLKCRIYGNGCLKRGKTEEGALYLRLPVTVKRELTPNSPYS